MKKQFLAFTSPIILTLSANAAVTTGVGWDGPGLGHADVSWYLGSTTSDLTYQQQFDITELALSRWADYADITFTYGSAVGADNQIDFFLGADSVDTNGFWGYAFSPDYLNASSQAGDIYIDDGTTAPLWTAGTTGEAEFSFVNDVWLEADIYYLLLHEIGHALGLDHPLGATDNVAEGAVMSPFFGFDSDGDDGFKAYDSLQADDIAGIQSLYAAAVPVPASAWLFASALLGFISLQRKR